MSKFRILELCKQKGITQKDLAETIGMTPVGLAKAANGNPTFETLEKIAAGLGVSAIRPSTDEHNHLPQVRDGAGSQGKGVRL